MEKEQGDLAAPKEAIVAEAGGKVTRNPLVHLKDLKWVVEDRLDEIEEVWETDYPISMTMIQAKIDDLDRAWIEFDTQHDRLSVISGRGRLFGLQAYHAELEPWYWGHISEAKEVLKEEQAKEAALKEDLAKEATLKEEQVRKAVLEKVVVVGGSIAAFE